MNKTEYYYKGVKVGIWGKVGNECTIVVDDEETAERLGGFLRHDESYLTWFYKTVNEKEIEVLEAACLVMELRFGIFMNC